MSGGGADKRIARYPVGWPTKDPPPEDEAHAMRILTVEVWERATLIMLGIAQKEDPTRGTTPVTAHVPVGTRSVKAPSDDALIVLVAPA
jgi:hypothetical protein